MNVFCIGLSKTGTTSLQQAILDLGYELRGEFIKQVDELTDVSTAPEDKHFYRISRCIHDYAEIDRRFPGSKFILTTRENGPWLKSCKHQFRHACEPGSKVWESRMQLFGTPDFDAERFSYVYYRHLIEVREYFAGRDDDLLVIDIAGGEGYDRLCPFLGEPMRKDLFPKENVSRSWSKLVRRFKQAFLDPAKPNAAENFRAPDASDSKAPELVDQSR